MRPAWADIREYQASQGYTGNPNLPPPKRNLTSNSDKEHTLRIPMTTGTLPRASPVALPVGTGVSSAGELLLLLWSRHVDLV